jgi:hypothetical protein
MAKLRDHFFRKCLVFTALKSTADSRDHFEVAICLSVTILNPNYLIIDCFSTFKVNNASYQKITAGRSPSGCL